MANRNQLPGSRNATFRGEFAGTPGYRSHETNLLEETMETRNTRLSVWAFVLFTFFALFGVQSAFAWDNHEEKEPRAQAAGQICKPGGAPPSGCQDVRFSLAAELEHGTYPEGRFEYENKTTKFNVKGRITSLQVKPHNNAATPDTSHPCFAAAIFDVDPLTGNPIQVAGPPLSAPYANLTGKCDDGTCDQFVITVVDDDSGRGNPDWVCNVHMHGTDKKGHSEVYDDPGQPLQRGKVEVHPE